MKHLLLALLVLLTLTAAGFAEQPDPKAIKSLLPPVENSGNLYGYYNEEFFNEPWRLGDGWKPVSKQTAWVAVAGVALYVLMRWRQRSA